MSAPATEEFRVRIDPKLLREAKRVANEIGLTPGDIVRMLFTQLVKLRGLPFRPSEFPALDEYGASIADAENAENRMFKEIAADRKVGKVFEFTGKLP